MSKIWKGIYLNMGLSCAIPPKSINETKNIRELRACLHETRSELKPV